MCARRHCVRTLCNGPIRQSGVEWWEICQLFSVLHCNVRDWSLSSRISFPPPPPPHLSLSLCLYIASCRQATRRSQVIVVVTLRNLEEKKKTLSHPLLVLFFVWLSHSFGHVVLTLTENRPEVVDFKRNKVT